MENNNNNQENSDKKPPIPVGNSIEQLFKMLAMQQNAPDTGHKKPMEDYKFWKTQPVPRLGDEITKEGPIDDKTVDQVAKEPYALPKEFEWVTVDIEDQKQLEEVYELLYYNYVEDDQEEFRMKYSPKFLEWALKCPGWYKEWMVGVRAASSKKLVAFISGVPSIIRVRENEPFKAAEINFLCVHKKLRSKRLAPVLIREVTRRVNLENIWQALYTGGRVLPSPISTARYYHRPLNWSKLYDVGFSSLPNGSTVPKEVARHALPNKAITPGWRKMNKSDLPQVQSLLEFYLKRFDVAPIFTTEELEHWLLDPLHAEDTTAPANVETFVIEQNGQVSEFVSYFGIESTVLGEDVKHDTLNIAYGFYCATKEGISEDGTKVVNEAAFKKRLTALHFNALICAKISNYDVYNLLTIMDNNVFMEDMKFRQGSGFLRYYLFNYKALPVPGGIDKLGELVKIENGGIGAILF